jgi:prepilin-type N-terminal cleavage/methylation domain-containing protein
MYFDWKNQQGFSLIELLTVIGLLSLIAGFALIMNLDDYRSFQFRDERNVLVTLLQKARSQAVNNVCLGVGCTDGQPHGVHIESGKYVIFQGSVYNPSSSTNQSFDANNTMTTTVSSPEVVFGQLSGQVAADWTITLQNQFGKTVSIQINKEGRIDY